MNKTAILVDGGFYRKVANRIFGKKNSQEAANQLITYCMRHLSEKNNRKHDLYRIFYYDCLPSTKKVYHPFLKRTVDLSESESGKWVLSFIEELKKKRKVAIRLGKISDINVYYSLKYPTVKQLANKMKNFEDLEEKDYMLHIEQKGVDMKIGLDIASLSYKKQVEQIILISGDSDFVPAAKLARREGIDFILDPMRNPIKDDLFEHIDGLRSCFSIKPIDTKNSVEQP